MYKNFNLTGMSLLRMTMLEPDIESQRQQLVWLKASLQRLLTPQLRTLEFFP